MHIAKLLQTMNFRKRTNSMNTNIDADNNLADI